jgi:hypothetical protein
VYAAGIENVVNVWDLRREEVSLSLAGHSDSITGMKLSPDGTHLLTNSMDNTLRWSRQRVGVGAIGGAWMRKEGQPGGVNGKGGAARGHGWQRRGRQRPSTNGGGAPWERAGGGAGSCHACALAAAQRNVAD